MKEKSISQFLNEENKEYSLYVLERRAMPSIIDGLKTTQRKVLGASKEIWKTGKNETFKKIYQLAGIIADSKKYHHGNVALENTIVGMGQQFKNNIELFDLEGQWGFLRVPQAGAARYIGCSLHSNFYTIFKDFNLTIKQFEEGYEIEPKYYLPIIPMIIINGSQGIAVGFASKILNRDPKRIIDVCIKNLKGQKYNKVFKPLIREFNGKVEQDLENPLKWLFYGTYEKVNKTTLRVTEFSPDMTYEKIEKHFSALEDSTKIVSYENNSKDKVDVIVKLKRDYLDNASDFELRKLLNTDSSITENLTMLDENENIIIFDNINDIINYFITFRLKFYAKRKKALIEDLEKNILTISNRLKFIKAIIDKKLSINNVAKDIIVKKIIALKISKIDNSYGYLLNMSIYSLTKELFDKLKKDLLLKKQELGLVKKRKEKEMYLEDLTILKKIIK